MTSRSHVPARGIRSVLLAATLAYAVGLPPTAAAADEPTPGATRGSPAVTVGSLPSATRDTPDASAKPSPTRPTGPTGPPQPVPTLPPVPMPALPSAPASGSRTITLPPSAAMVAARADLSESTAQVAAAVAALASTQATLQAAQDREAAANAVVMQAQERYDEAAMEAGRAQTVLVMVQRASDGAQRDVSDAADQAGRTAREAYVQGPLSGVAALFESGSVTDLQDRMAALDSVGRSQRSRTASLQATAAGYSDRAGALSTQRDALAVQRDRVEARIQDLNGAEAAAHASSALLLTAVKAHELSLATAQTAADDDERRYQEMTAESVSVTTGIGSLPQLIPTTTPAGAHLQIPAQGPVTSPFGYRVHPITGVYKLHTGTDFGVPCGTPVHAAADGAVLSTTLTTAYGNRLVMVHPALGIATTYNHLTSFLVPPGTAVHQGDVIALSGTTGYSTGCHLHFEVVAYGGYVDPAPWLGLP